MTVNNLRTLNLAYLIGVASSRGTSPEKPHWKSALPAAPGAGAESTGPFLVPNGQAEQTTSQLREPHGESTTQISSRVQRGFIPKQ